MVMGHTAAPETVLKVVIVAAPGAVPQLSRGPFLFLGELF
jgi:hypothetical protein